LHPEQKVSDQFNISVAQPLSSYPIIAIALKALKSSKEEALLKRSPFVIELKPLQVGVAKAPLTYWAELFEHHLKSVGWPGTRILNSIEHQAMARWQLLLGELAALDTVLEMQDLKGALQWLVELANETPFQGQSKPAPIHIMGILEASSQPFEYLWITGLNNEAWPPIPRANPFLPMALQRSYNMPHASNEREYAFSKKLLEKLKQACNTVILSYYKNDAVKSYYPSYLLSDLEEENLVFKVPSHPGIQSPAILESIEDNKGPSLVNGTRCKGGASLFQAQAVCPFKAFAHYRLKAKPKDKEVIGLSAQERGILVHKLIEQLWAILKTSCQIGALQEQQLDKILNSNIQSLRWRYPNLGDFFWEVEYQRLKSILLNWFALEKKRDPFQVLAQEQKQSFDLGGLKWELKVDRIDKDEEGNLIIIDYKTSDQKLAECLDERLQSPQLPLYCMTSKKPPKAVVFGQLQAQNCKFVGLSEYSNMIPGVKGQPNWDHLLMQWKNSLESLALEFKNGEAKVSPHKADQNCRQCRLWQLCRVKENE
jgi:ATP-dependent helicase/nuclease subunit B